jgi:hypothetical protein
MDKIYEVMVMGEGFASCGSQKVAHPMAIT